MRRPSLLSTVFGIALAAALPARALAQGGAEYRLDKSGQWQKVSSPEAGTDAATIAEARNLIAEGRPESAKTLLDQWLAKHENEENAFLPQGYLLHGDALTASGYEYKALYDYELVVRRFPASEEFVTSLERELEIAVKYVNGLKYKWLGLRVWDASDIGEELLIRVQECLPNSRLAERAGIELGDYYYRNHELEWAGIAYEMFLQNYRNSSYRMQAMERRVYAAIGQYKGPKYDSSSLIDAQTLIRKFGSLYPEEAEQAGLNDALVVRLDESAAAELLQTARWYLKQKDQVSARYTLSRLVEKYPSSAAGTLGLQIMTQRGWTEEKKPPEPPAQTPTQDPKPAPDKPATPTPSAPPPAKPPKEPAR